MAHIFLSYTRTDVWIMRSLSAYFRAAGFEIWADEKLDPGTPDWQVAIENAIKESGCLIVILSPGAAASKWVREEIRYAEQQKVPIFPVLAWGEEKDSIPFGLAGSQWMDIRQSYDLQMEKLAVSIKNQTNVSNTLIVPRSNAKEDSILWERTGSLFWFADDTRKLRMRLAQGKGSAKELHGELKQCLHHASRLRVDKSILRELEVSVTQTKDYNDEDWTPELRRRIEARLRTACHKLSHLAEIQEEDFNPGPEWE